MADKKHVKMLRKGSGVWNGWRKQNPHVVPDLSKADLSSISLGGIDLTRADLRQATLRGADLRSAKMEGANLSDADLGFARLDGANLTDAKLGGASLEGATAEETIWPTGFSIESHEFWRGMKSSTSEEPIPREVLDRSVKELDLSIRSYNCLKRDNIQTIRELVGKNEAELLKSKNFGRKSLSEITEVLSRMGLVLGMRIDANGNVLYRPMRYDFIISFVPELSAAQIKATLQALADYYRACGGVGLKVDFELEEVLRPEPIHV